MTKKNKKILNSIIAIILIAVAIWTLPDILPRIVEAEASSKQASEYDLKIVTIFSIFACLLIGGILISITNIIAPKEGEKNRKYFTRIGMLFALIIGGGEVILKVLNQLHHQMVIGGLIFMIVMTSFFLMFFLLIKSVIDLGGRIMFSTDK